MGSLISYLWSIKSIENQSDSEDHDDDVGDSEEEDLDLIMEIGKHLRQRCEVNKYYVRPTCDLYWDPM